MNRYHTFWRRLGASILDELVLIPIFIVGSYIEVDNVVIVIIWILLSSFLYLAYFVWFHGRHGQTFGKKLVNITVFDLKEKDVIGIRRALFRESFLVVATITGLIYFTGKTLIDDNLNNSLLSSFNHFLSTTSLVWLLIELISMFTNPKRRALHDYLAKSVVIKNE